MADFTLKAHDRRPSIQATLSQGGVVVDLTSAVSVKFIMAATPAGTVIVNTVASIVTPASGIVRYDWGASDTSTPGTYLAEWEVTWATGIKQTFPTLTTHTISILADLDNA